MAEQTVGERISSLEATVRERTKAIEDKIDTLGSGVSERMVRMEGEMLENRRGIADNSRHLSSLQKELDKYRNRAIGWAAGSAGLIVGADRLLDSLVK